MRFGHVTSLILLLGLALATVGCERFDEAKTVAKVATLRITVGEFRQHYARGKPWRAFGRVPMSARRKHLNRMIDARLKYIDAVVNHFDQDSLYVSRLKKTRDRLVLEALMREKILYRIISERTIKQWYKHSGRTLHVKRILISTENDTLPRQILRHGALAWRLYEQLRKGARFDSLATRYSDDEVSKKKKGDMGWIQWGRYPARMSKAIFALKKGELGKPVRTANGFEIFKVVDERVQDLPRYSAMRDALLSRIRNAPEYKGRIDKAQKAFIQEVQRRLGFEKNDFGYNHFSGQMKIRKAMVLSGGAKEGSDQFEHIPQTSYKYVLYRWRGDSLTIGDVIRYIRQRSRRMQPDLTEPSTFKSWVDGIAKQKLLTDYAYQLHFERHPYVRRGLHNFRLRVLPVVADNIRVRRQVSISDEELQKYYEAHKERFVQPPMRKVREILISDYDVAEEVARRARAGESFEKLAEKFNERFSTKKKKGLIGWVREDGYGEISQMAFKGKVGQVIGPFRNGVKWSVILVEDARPARQRTFEEAKKEILNRMRGARENQRRQEWLRELRAKYRPVVFEKNLALTFLLPQEL